MMSPTSCTGALGRAVVFRLERLPTFAPPIVDKPAAFASFGVDFADRHAEHGATNLAVLDQVVHDLLRQRDRNREAVAGVVAGAARDRAVDADDVAANVEQRTARVARVDRGVGLDVVGDRVAGC